jgi:glycosyltransferase involved in cell wall biosynthesis
MISIVMAYHNRRKQFEQTFGSILKYSIQKDIELIIVDDASKESERLEDIISCLSWVKLIRIEPKDKCWVNPCIPYNIGFNKVTGDKVIIQNPECEHIGNIIEFVENNLTDHNYLSFACQAYNQKGQFKQWYNHPIINSTNLHFCSAITKKNLDILGGFDERFSDGLAYDDNEFLHRVKRLGLSVECVEYPFVKHQWHEKIDHFANPKYRELIKRNKAIFETLTMKES